MKKKCAVKKEDEKKEHSEITDCFHMWVEIEQNRNAGELEILSECEKCGLKSIEKYRFVKGHELDKDGNVISTYH